MTQFIRLTSLAQRHKVSSTLQMRPKSLSAIHTYNHYWRRRWDVRGEYQGGLVQGGNVVLTIAAWAQIMPSRVAVSFVSSVVSVVSVVSGQSFVQLLERSTWLLSAWSPNPIVVVRCSWNKHSTSTGCSQRWSVLPRNSFAIAIKTCRNKSVSLARDSIRFIPNWIRQCDDYNLSLTDGSTTLSRMNLSGYVGDVTIFSWMFTIACCLVVWLGLLFDLVSGW